MAKLGGTKTSEYSDWSWCWSLAVSGLLLSLPMILFVQFYVIVFWTVLFSVSTSNYFEFCLSGEASNYTRDTRLHSDRKTFVDNWLIMQAHSQRIAFRLRFTLCSMFFVFWIKIKISNFAFRVKMWSKVQEIKNTLYRIRAQTEFYECYATKISVIPIKYQVP